MVLDYVNYFMNITEANLKAKPTWLKEYSAKVRSCDQHMNTSLQDGYAAAEILSRGLMFNGFNVQGV